MSADLVTQLRQDAQAQREAAPEGAALWVADRFDQAAGEIASLHEAIRRLADQDATLSICNGNVIVEMDATLTDAEREAVARAIATADDFHDDAVAATLRGLLERTK